MKQSETPQKSLGKDFFLGNYEVSTAFNPGEGFTKIFENKTDFLDLALYVEASTPSEDWEKEGLEGKGDFMEEMGGVIASDRYYLKIEFPKTAFGVFAKLQGLEFERIKATEEVVLIFYGHDEVMDFCRSFSEKSLTALKEMQTLIKKKDDKKNDA